MKKVLIIERDHHLNPLYHNILAGKYELEFADSIDILQNRALRHQPQGRLEYYDLIVMDPYISHYPLYTYTETFSMRQTGWFLYRDFMADLKTKIIIWTNSVEQYSYGENNYPGRAWGPNVAGVFKKDYITSR